MEISADNICRICLKESLFHFNICTYQVVNGKQLLEVINDLLHLDAEYDDGFPQFVCPECYKNISDFELFKRTAHEGKYTLLSLRGSYGNEHELNSESESLPWESCKTEDDSNFEQKNDVSDLGSRELCGSTLALHRDWIKPDYSATEHEKDDVNPAGLDQVEAVVKSEFSNGNASYCGGSNLMQPNEESVADQDVDDHLSYPVKVEPENSSDEASDGREDTPYEEYIGIDPDDLAYNGVGFDETTPAATDPLQDTFLTDGLKEEDLSPEAMPVEDTFLTDGLKEEDLSPEAMPVEVNRTSTHSTLEGEGKGGPNKEVRRERVEIVTSTVKEIEGNGKHMDKCEEANSPDASGRCRKITANNQLEGTSKQRTYSCDTCGNGFNEKRDLMFHIRIHTGEKSFRCDICSKAFSCKTNFNEHVLSHGSERPNQCRLYGKRFTYRSGLAIHLKTHQKKKYGCTFCEKKLCNKSALEKHLTTHSDEKPFLCNVCGRSFKVAYRLRRHLGSVHGGVKRFRCDICGKEFFRKSWLVNHIAAHGDERPYACEVCRKTYKTKDQARNHHRNTHSGLRPHSCTFCAKQFLSKAHLKRHLATHTGEVPFECGNCGRRFNESSNLMRHMKSICKTEMAT